MLSTLLSRLRFGPALAILSANLVHAQIETWSTVGDDRGWTSFGIADVSGVAHDGVGALAFSASNYSEFYVIADVGASGGIFTGSYAGYASIGFDLFVDSTSTVDSVSVRLADVGAANEWLFSLTPFFIGSAASYVVPLDPSGTGWVQSAGADPFSTLLGSVGEFSLLFVAADQPLVTENLLGALDNVGFTPVPEPASAALLGAAAGLSLALTRRRRR